MTIVDIILWIVVGGLAGWIASIIMKTDAQQGATANVIIGILGAIVGGWVAGLLGFATPGAFSLAGILVAVVGSVILIALMRMFRSTA